MVSKSMKETIRQIVSWTLCRSGFTKVWRKCVRSKGTLILMGHCVGNGAYGNLPCIPTAWFEEMLVYLATTFRCISLSELITCYEKGIEPPGRSVVVTFDDGYIDNYTTVFPLLRKYHIPATFFLVTECIDTGQLPWPQRLSAMILETKKDHVHLDFPGSFTFHSRDERMRVFWEIFHVLKTQSKNEREAFLKQLEDLLEVSPPRGNMMTWEHVLEMARAGMEFGSHTVSHPWMAYLSEDEAWFELTESKKRLTEVLGSQPFSFAFPGGSSNHVHIEMVKKVGYRSVFQSKFHICWNHPFINHPFSLSRIGFPIGKRYILEAEVDSPKHFLSKLFLSN